MKHIKQTVVVEGKDDERRLKQLYDVDIIRTEGTHLSKEVIERIRISREINGIIIFTDQDHPGEMIRKRINDEIPGCQNAFLKKNRENRIGVENATEEEIEEALANLLEFTEAAETLTYADFYSLGLQGQKDSKEKRIRIEEYYHLGHGTAKTLFSRLNSRRLTKKELEEFLNE